MQSPINHRTALILIDIQLGLTHPTFYGTQPRSNPSFESNIKTLLHQTRTYNEFSTTTNPIQIIHIHHHSNNPSSPLHPSSNLTWAPLDATIWPDTAQYLLSLATTDNNNNNNNNPSTLPNLNPDIKSTHPLPCSQPLPSETTITKTTSSAFTPETNLEFLLQSSNITQILICGLVIDHCVNSSIRGAFDSRVWVGGFSGGGDYGGKGGNGDDKGEKEKRIILVQDCCAGFGKGGVDAEVVHRVHVGSLRGEFCTVLDLGDVLDGVKG